MANSIKLRKVNVLRQTCYTYESVTGEIITIYPDACQARACIESMITYALNVPEIDSR